MKLDWLAVLKILGESLAPLVQAYNLAREEAKKSGVTDADLDAADARWLRRWDDPKPPTT